MDTAGRAVLFAGTTVVIALLGMMLLGVDFLYGVAISASIGVLLVMLASLTLLPALLTIAGARVARPSRRTRARKPAPAIAAELGSSAVGRTRPRRTRRRRRTAAYAGEGPAAAARAWLRWSAFVQRRPWTIATRLHARDAADRRARDRAAARLQRRLQRPREPDHAPRLRAARRRASAKGFNGPLLVVAKVPNPKREAAGRACS